MEGADQGYQRGTSRFHSFCIENETEHLETLDPSRSLKFSLSGHPQKAHRRGEIAREPGVACREFIEGVCRKVWLSEGETRAIPQHNYILLGLLQIYIYIFPRPNIIGSLDC